MTSLLPHQNCLHGICYLMHTAGCFGLLTETRVPVLVGFSSSGGSSPSPAGSSTPCPCSLPAGYDPTQANLSGEPYQEQLLAHKPVPATLMHSAAACFSFCAVLQLDSTINATPKEQVAMQSVADTDHVLQCQHSECRNAKACMPDIICVSVQLQSRLQGTAHLR